MAFSQVDEIKNRLDIVEVIGSYVKLQKAGRNLKAPCPFHSEKTPSFMVSPERQIWHCFGCGLGGDIFAFVKQIEGIEFGDALRTLANRAGIVLKRQDETLNTKRRRLYEVCELATKFFETQLAKSLAGKKAFDYLKGRGIKNETIKNWRLGWAPDDWHALEEFLKKRSYQEKEIFDAGLTVASEQASAKRSKFHDRFRSRIMFPLFDIHGQAVGFAGRIFGKEDKDVGKYINTPQTALYDKSRLLYGLNFAKIDLRQENSCILVEGNLDVIASHQAGVKNVVASSGTALTSEHLKIIRRYTENIIFSFDTDLAGESATKRSIDLALANDFNVKIIKIEEKDPADLIKQSPEKWQKAIRKTISILDYYFGTTFAKYSADKPEDKKQIAKILLPIISTIPNQIEKAHWVGELAKKIKTDEKTIYSEMQKIKPSAAQQKNGYTPKDEISQKKENTRINELEERILSLYLNYPDHLKDFSDQPKKVFFNQELAKILEELKLTSQEKKEKDQCLTALKKKLPAELYSQMDYIFLKNDEFPGDEKEIANELKSCIKEIKIIKLKEEMIKLGFEIQDAQTKKDKAELNKKLEKFKKLSKELLEITKE